MDFSRYKEINDQRLNYNEMEDATVVSSYRNTGCGDGYRIYLKINEGQLITDASYTTTGCGFGVVALAMATEIVKNKTVEEAKNLTEDDIEKAFSFPERRKNYPQSAIAALQKAFKDYEDGTGVPPEDRVTRKKALEILQQQGHLKNTNLSSIILEKENFENVDFQESNLHNAFLQNSNFAGANFSGANLRGAFLNNANLQNANFRDADLRWAKLSGAKLEGADFTGAKYDIGTRIDSSQLDIYKVMVKTGKDIYIKK
ncbi:MAG: pentapeptide repeat-containing protein [Spirochaetota bacterium]